jgi:geranylgeranyl diphosphate synthase type II
MMIVAYDYINNIKGNYLHRILNLFNKTAKQVCEGQQLDMDFEKMGSVSLQEYMKMIELKTSVLLAASLQMGAIIGGATQGNCDHLYEFGRNLGIAFQIQDDYLDAFGEPEKFGKDIGGDIRQNKKTFLLLQTLQVADGEQKAELQSLMLESSADKVQRVLAIFRACDIDEWARDLKQQYIETAYRHLDDIAVVSSRKKPLLELAEFLVQRQY